MKVKKVAGVVVFAAMAAGLVATSVWFVRLNARVKELEEVKSKSEEVKSGSEAGKTGSEKRKSEEIKSGEPLVVTNLPPQMAVLGVEYEGEKKQGKK